MSLSNQEALPCGILTSDVAVLDRLLDDLLLFTSIDGTLACKNDDYPCSVLDACESRLGETSVVSVRMNAEAAMDGVPVTATLRYTRVWHKRPEGWRLVAGHMSTVSA